ncbi:MAG: type II toxin-antitoxin system death-on-curing family toxin, partial [Nitrospirales bacterium]
MYRLAAAYFHWILRNHLFVDSNKRTAPLTGSAFLGRNTKKLIASEAEATQLIIDLVSK